MLRVYQLSLASVLLASWVPTSTANVCLQVKGLSGALEKNVRIQLSSIDSNTITLDWRFRTHVKDMIKKSLKALGYYEPTINFNLRPPSSKCQQVMIVRISPGKPVLLGRTKVVVRGSASTDQDYLNLLATRPKDGSVLNHDDYDHFKKNLTNMALRKGYFDGQFTTSQLGVSVERHYAFWDIDYDSGERYRFGNVVFRGSQIRDEYLQNLIPFKRGDYYQSSALGELNRRLSATGWFNSVVIAPELNEARKTKILPLRGIVSPRKKNAIEMGIGYSTDIGPHVKAMWEKPWINSYGHSLTVCSNISVPERQFDFKYKVPLWKNPLKHYYLLHGGFKRTTLKNIEQDANELSISRYWELSNHWQQAIILNWSLEDHHYIQENVGNTITLLYPSIIISRTRLQNSLMPLWGNSQRYSIDYSNSFWGSDANFSVVQAQGVWIRTLYSKHRFVMRGNFGWIETNDFEYVPSNLRFFAGGDRSIRGYKYKSISPENKKTKLVGASKLATGSLEYQYKVRRKWWLATFIDSGEAVNDIRKSNFKIGTGIGVRWQSPVGALKFDFAIPIGDKDNQGLQFYIGLGHEL